MEDAASRVAELRQKMENMGPVNLVAIEDCQKSEERLDFLVGQESDLVQAKEKLLALIKDIDRQSVARFRDTFTKANENFQKMYTRLFGGGTAELRLLDAENVLECGIDIVARPPGKKPTSVSLLSGGERTMTAVALLFSIYEIKPSPFAILDELDAALDDSNIGRFVDVLKDFLSLSQFLIITHNQHTIAGSDIVYGVTQQEKGVSTIISMRLKRVGVEELKGEELPELDTPKGPSERKLRRAENFVKKAKNAVVAALALSAPLLFAPGCASTDREGRIPHESFAVAGSGLDHVSFVYDPAPGSERFPHPFRLELYGTGLVTFRTGPSPQVRDSFSTASADPDWQRMVQGRFAVSPDEMRDILQVFVDEGMVPSRAVRGNLGAAPVVQYAGNVNNKKFRNATSNAVLVDAVEDFAETNFARELAASARWRRPAPPPRR